MFWNLVDPSLTREDTKKKDIENKLKLKAFYQHCCRSRHYFFSIKKCGEENCVSHSECRRKSLQIASTYTKSNELG